MAEETLVPSKSVSIFYVPDSAVEFKEMSLLTFHDLGLDSICHAVTDNSSEYTLICKMMRQMTNDVHTARYRADVFEDLRNLPDLRNELVKLLEHINFLHDYGTFTHNYDGKISVWNLMHRFDEIKDYIDTIETLHSCLDREDIQSEALKSLTSYISNIYKTHFFEEMKKDISSLKANTNSIRSITLGVNLNSRFEAESVGIISVNDTKFTKSGILGNLGHALTRHDNIQSGNDWNQDMGYTEVSRRGKSSDREEWATLAGIPESEGMHYITRGFEKSMDYFLSNTVIVLQNVLNKYVNVTVQEIIGLVPEFFFYVKWLEFIDKYEGKGFSFCKPNASSEAKDDKFLHVTGLYNLRLPIDGNVNTSTLVRNTVNFGCDKLLYILTGANRGGKTTITQAVGQMFVLAQCGIFTPAREMTYVPVDMVYTHFPADEDKTMDLGRLGEECNRFRDIFKACSPDSLLLLNETFSTTSFEEGFYIAVDSMRAVLSKGIRTIYNTHMHKVAFELDSINEVSDRYKACSMVMRTINGIQSFKVEVAPPEGKSYAADVAEKYGVTYELLLKEDGT